jgi:hypothetical protein
MLWNGNKCGKPQGNENIKAPVHDADYDRPKTKNNWIYVIFQIFW